MLSIAMSFTANAQFYVIATGKYEVSGEPTKVGERAEEWSEWADDGVHYDCTEWNPHESTMPLDDVYTKSRDCDQDQVRERDIYYQYSDGSESFNHTEYDYQTLIEQESEQAIGTKPIYVEFVKIAAGYDHAVALDGIGNVWVVGDNQFGQLGLGDTNHRYEWVKTSIKDATDVYAGYDFSYIVKDNELHSAGKNSDGQLALGHTSNINSFTATGFKDFTQVDLGTDFAYAIKNGDLYVVGNNNAGQLGIGNKTDKSSFTQTSYQVSDVAAGGSFGQILVNGTVYSTGSDYSGALGLGSTHSVQSFTATSLNGVSDIETMIGSSYAVKNGEIYSVGKNNNGQLALGHTINQNTYKATGVTGFTTLEANGDSGYMIKMVIYTLLVRVGQDN